MTMNDTSDGATRLPNNEGKNPVEPLTTEQIELLRRLGTFEKPLLIQSHRESKIATQLDMFAGICRIDGMGDWWFRTPAGERLLATLDAATPEPSAPCQHEPKVLVGDEMKGEDVTVCKHCGLIDDDWAEPSAPNSRLEAAAKELIDAAERVPGAFSSGELWNGPHRSPKGRIVDQLKMARNNLAAALDSEAPAKQPWQEDCDYCDNGRNLAPGTCGACGREEPHRCGGCDAILDAADVRNGECHDCGQDYEPPAANPDLDGGS